LFEVIGFETIIDAMRKAWAAVLVFFYLEISLIGRTYYNIGLKAFLFKIYGYLT